MLEIVRVPPEREIDASTRERDIPESLAIVETARLQLAGYLAERMADAKERIVASQTRVLQAKLGLEASRQSARCEVARLARRAEEELADLQLWQHIRTGNAAAAKRQLEQATETERLLCERERYRKQRLTGSFDPVILAPSVQGAPLPGELPVQQHISESDIETLAMKAVVKFAHLDLSTAEKTWESWRQELSKRFPAYVTREVINRAAELKHRAEGGR